MNLKTNEILIASTLVFVFTVFQTFSKTFYSYQIYAFAHLDQGLVELMVLEYNHKWSMEKKQKSIKFFILPFKHISYA